MYWQEPMTRDELYHEEPFLWLRKDTTMMEHTAIRAELQSHIDILFILKAVNKPNNEPMT